MSDFSTKAAATEAGRITKAKLDRRWPTRKLRVWENLGWHYDLRRGPLSLSPTFAGRFMCLVCNRPESDGSGTSWIEYNCFGPTAIRTVEKTVRSFRLVFEAKVAMFQAVLDGLPEVK